MLPTVAATIKTTPVSLEEARSFCWIGPIQPAIGHADTAALAVSQLGAAAPELTIETAAMRPTVSLQSGDMLLVLQYSGPRLPEGTTALPEGAVVKWLLVDVTF